MNKRLFTTIVAAGMLAALALPTAALAAKLRSPLLIPPDNDNFANATPISTLPFTASVDITEATTEPDEPQPCAYSPQTVWYAVTPSTNVVIRVDMAGSSFSDTSLVVYQAASPNLADLSFVSCAAWGGSLNVNALAETTYYIQAGNIYGGGGNLQLNVQEVPPPANDHFTNATSIPTLPFDDSVDTAAATREAGEPTSPCDSSPLSGTVWYAFTPASPGSVTASVISAGFSTIFAVYTGNSLDALTHLDCRNNYFFGGPLTFRADAGTTYFFQVAGLFGLGGPLQFHLEVAPPPVANFGFSPGDPSVFDNVQFFDFSFDPGGLGIQTRAWDFGDGATTTGPDCCPFHRYTADGDYNVQLTVTTPDGRSASTSQVVQVRTHDVAITRFAAPQSASAGQTRTISVGIRNTRYPETVEVQLFKSTPGGFQFIGSSIQSVPVRSANRTTRFSFSYTFTSDDAAIGKVTFKAVATLVNARDALPADNEAIASPTKVNR